MHFKTVAALALASFGASASASKAAVMQNAAVYAQNFAPGEMARIHKFNESHAATLTGEQSNFLEDALAAIGAPTAADIPGLEEACASLFGDEQCAEILSGKTTTSASRMARRAAALGLGAVLGRRADPACECSDGSDWCGTGFQCARPGDAGGIECSPGSGCGTFALYECNGLCVSK